MEKDKFDVLEIQQHNYRRARTKLQAEENKNVNKKRLKWNKERVTY